MSWRPALEELEQQSGRNGHQPGQAQELPKLEKEFSSSTSSHETCQDQNPSQILSFPLSCLLE